MRSVTLRHRALVAVTGLALVFGPAINAASAVVLLGDIEQTLGGEVPLRPQDLGGEAPEGLVYPDPAEGIDLIDPPVANNGGSAQLTHPISMPAGRAGLQPDLALSYDSGGGSGWVGTGWDLGVSSISVDTRWGVPRYDPAKETETYQLDGQLLSPTAVRSAFVNRRRDTSGSGEVFTRRVDTVFEQILRHGSGPGSYWWEVRDKVGNIRFYGAIPSYNATTGVLSATRDPASILAHKDGQEAEWGLTAEIDVSYNIVRYFYEKSGYVFGTWASASGDDPTGGRQMWLQRITYTGTIADVTKISDDPAYEVRFLRDLDITPRPARRRDIELDARRGFLQTTPDLLRAIEVVYRPTPPATGLVRRYDLTYRHGGADKSLLEKITLVGATTTTGTPAPVSHTFSYFEDVGAGGDYKGGFGPYDGSGNPVSQAWESESDNLHEFLLFKDAKNSQLGTSVTNSGDFHLYLGFNPTLPKKLLSFGGSISVGGQETFGLNEFMDINGDLLPDKVFRTEVGETIQYRLNLGRPGPTGQPTFGPKRNVVGLTELSRDGGFSISGGPEAYPGPGIQFSVGGGVGIGRNYFADVNNDGLPDFVRDGVVFFNYLDNGVPTFTTDSSKTSVPIDDATLTITPPAELAELEERQRKASPLQDTVRRWVAPYGGRVRISGDVTYDPPLLPGQTATGDGIKVSIENEGAVLWTATITDPATPATPTGVSDIQVSKGEAIYFRLQAGADGVGTEAKWDPLIHYLFPTPADQPPLDVNGLSQVDYQASDDFTLAGRPGAMTFLPVRGTARIAGAFSKTKATSDDLRIVVLRNGTAVRTETVAGNFVGDVAFTHDLTVPQPVGGNFESVQVRVVTDSAVDLHAFSWNPRMWYTAAFDADGNPIPVFDNSKTPPVPSIVVNLPFDADLFGESSLTAPSRPWTSDLDRTVTAHAELTTGKTPGGRAVLTVKTRDGLLAKTVINVTGSETAKTTSVDLSVTLQDQRDYWFDISTTDPGLSASVTGQSVQLRWKNDQNQDQTRDVPSTRYATGAQSIFPVAYRGWAYAGYNGEGDRATKVIDPNAFTIKESAFDNLREPTGFDDTEYNDPVQGEAFAFVATMVDIRDQTGRVIGQLPAWRGTSDDILGAAGVARAAKPGGSFAIGANSGSARAPTLVSVSAPSFAFAASALVAGAGVSAGWEFGLVDFMDMNGDGYPDAVTPKQVKYTGPRGSYIDEKTGLDALTVLSQDTGFSFSGGFNGSAPEFKGSRSPQKAAASSTKGGNSGTQSTGGDDASSDEYGVQLGLSLGFTYGMGNPVLSDPRVDQALGNIPKVEAYLEEKLADVNGDGLPDKVRVNNDGVYVRLNQGYGFAAAEVLWSTGGFETGESYAGSVGPSFGFAMPFKEFAGGLTYNESMDLSLFAWVDVNGDGLLDRVRRVKAATPEDERVKVAFGTGAGLSPTEVDYGDVRTSAFDLTGTSTGQQIAVARSRGSGGGVDFTIAIPACPPGPCFVIINPGIHFEHSLSTTNLELVDVNGDGLPDSVSSEQDNELLVRVNSWGRTNLLRSVVNPFGGEIRLGYRRDGNTPDQPYPVWNLSSVQVDDNRAGDGPDTLVSTYEYSGNAFNSLEREFLGYSRVRRADRDPGTSTPWDVAANIADPEQLEVALRAMPILRTLDQRYLNGHVFAGGLVEQEIQRGEATTAQPDGPIVRQSVSAWTFVDPETGAEVDLRPSLGDPAGVRLLSMDASPRLTRFTERWFAPNGTVGQETSTVFTYDQRGNIVIQADEGEPEDPADDLVAEITYASCADSALSIPTTFTLYHPKPDGSRELLRYRDGGDDVCENGATTLLREQYGPNPDDVVVTVLDFDAWGNYDCIWQGAVTETVVDDKGTTDPTDDTSEEVYSCRPKDTSVLGTPASYRVEYVFDADRHSDIAKVTDSHGISAEAKYHGPTGHIAERLDANGAKTTYSYDGLGRLESIVGPYEQGTTRKSVEFKYFPTAPDYAYASAHHFDRFATNAADTIDTARFLDGTGRETQTKVEATVAGATPGSGTNQLIVAGAVEFDALGRPIKEWQPTTQPLANIGVYKTDAGPSKPALTDWDDADRMESFTAPDGAKTERTYGFGDGGFLPATVWVETTKDPGNRQQVRYLDVHENVLAIEQVAPAPDGTLRTRYVYDPVGQLLSVTDTQGRTTTHTYDLAGFRLTTETPDGGLVEQEWDAIGNLVAVTDPRSRAAGERTEYEYLHDRLMRIDYPGSTPDVTYQYGAPNSGGTTRSDRGAGRIVEIDDGARTRKLEYDLLGRLAAQVDRMKMSGAGGARDLRSQFTWDGLGRLRTMRYPDGEVVTYDYDRGGLLSGVSGVKGPFSYRYVDRLEYDHFQSRRFQANGNGSRTSWSYHPDNRRLERQVTTNPARTIQDVTVGYDLVGNVKTLINTITSPQENMQAGTSTQTYDYDGFYRLKGSTGHTPMKPTNVRSYCSQVTYTSGRMSTKTQVDQEKKASDPVASCTAASAPGGGGGGGGNAGGGGNGGGGVGGGSVLGTNYRLGAYAYRPGQDQIESIDGRPYRHDENGNTTGWKGLGTDDFTLTWDSNNRLTSVTDGRTTNRFRYDDTGRLAIVNGINAATAFINPWYTMEAAVGWKSIWVGSDRLVVKQVKDITEREDTQFFFHKNLQGSTHVITDVTGRIFLRYEYFPSGEPWIREGSTTSKTPDWFTGAYLDPDFHLLNQGARWYDFRTEQMLSPDPLLVDDPGRTVDDPNLLPAYVYAASSPVGFVDTSGRQYTTIAQILDPNETTPINLPPLPAPPRPTSAHPAPPRPSSPHPAPPRPTSPLPASSDGTSGAPPTASPSGPAPARPTSPAPATPPSGRFLDPRPVGMRRSVAKSEKLADKWEARPLLSLAWKRGSDGKIHLAEVTVALVSSKIKKTWEFGESKVTTPAVGSAPPRPTSPLPAAPPAVVNPVNQQTN